MFRDLAKCTARLKGSRYEGAIIAAAVWEKTGGTPTIEPQIIIDRHKLLKVRAIDFSGTLTINMFLGKNPPLPLKNSKGQALLTAAAAGKAKLPCQLNFKFSMAEVTEFITAVNDTNPLHRQDFLNPPLVPGLLIMEKILQTVDFKLDRLSLKFSVPSFAADDIFINLETKV